MSWPIIKVRRAVEGAGEDGEKSGLKKSVWECRGGISGDLGACRDSVKGVAKDAEDACSLLPLLPFIPKNFQLR